MNIVDIVFFVVTLACVLITLVIFTKLCDALVSGKPINHPSKKELEDIVRMHAPQIIDDEWESMTRREGRKSNG